MHCDLCKCAHTTGNLLCEACADLIHRVVVVNARMNTRDICATERLAGTSLAANEASTAMPH